VTVTSDVLDAVKNGEEFDGKGTVILDGEFLCALVVGDVARAGVQIRGSIIDGALHLANARGASGEAANALILRQCVLNGEAGADLGTPAIDASHAHLQRLSLIDCSADGVELSGAMIVDDLVLDGVGPREPERGCWVKACGARVGGCVTARRANLSLPPWRHAEGEPPIVWPPASMDCWKTVTRPYALDLTDAQISGPLLLAPNFTSLGGVSIAGASIGGRFDGSGGRIEAAGKGLSTEALFAQYVEIAGPVMLQVDDRFLDGERFRAVGDLWFYGARIGGTLDLSGAEVRILEDPERVDDLWALDLYSSSLSADLNLASSPPPRGKTRPLWPCEIPTVNLSTAAIAGAVYIEGPTQRPIESIQGTPLKIGGDLNLSGSVARTDLSGSVVEGRVRISGSIEAPIRDVNARGLRVNDSAELSGPVSAACDLSGSVFNGDLEIGVESPLSFFQVRESAEPPALKLVGVSVGRTLRIARITPFPGDLSEGPSLREAELLSHPGWRLVEARYLGSNEAALAFLYRPDGRKEVVVLDGESARIHGLNDEQTPTLETERQVQQYLSLFCNYTWAERGAFRIDAGPPPIVARRADGSWKAQSQVQFGSERFEATFSIEPSGMVEMTDDEPIEEAPEDVPPTIYYEPPFRVGERGWVPRPAAFDFEFRSGLRRVHGWGRRLARRAARITGETHVTTWDDVEAAIRRSIAARKRPVIDLRRMKVHALDDAEGTNWGVSSAFGGRTQLRLSGFEYGRIESASTAGSHEQPKRRGILSAFRARSQAASSPGGTPPPKMDPKKHVRDRRQWLHAQYTSDPPHIDEYRPQPYQQLARVLRAAGDFDAADDIARDKLRLEKVRIKRTGMSLRKTIQHHVSQRLWRLFVDLPFGFGLKPWRAFGTFVLFWFVGFVATLALSGVLKIDASAVATVASSGAGDRVVVEEATGGSALEEVECADHISRIMYPLDVMIPLLDLRQESRCQLSIKESWWVFDWGFVKGVYAVVGWLVLSGLILTLSGVVRRRVEA
jgi:hypothetical protein